jgi:hypothetical protein
MKHKQTMQQSLKYLTVSLFTMLVLLSTAQGQESPVVLSMKQLNEVLTPGSNEITFLAEISVSEPKLLEKVEITIYDKRNMGMMTQQFFYFFVKEGKPFMGFDKYDLPFVDNAIQIPIIVKDQWKDPSHKLMIKGYDSAGKSTNVLEYTRIND